MRNKDISKLLLTAMISIWFLAGCGGGSGTNGSATGTQNQSADSLVTEGGTDTISNTENTTGDGSISHGGVSKFAVQAEAEDIAASKDTLFVAEGDKGVEIIKIGYRDRLDHELITTINGINARHVSLSDDKTKLYVENTQGFVNIFDITDINAPRKERIVTKASLETYPTTADGVFQFEPKEDNGLAVYNISNPSHKILVSNYKKSPVYDLVLIDHDSKAIAATKTRGIDLLDISDYHAIHVVANEPIEGETLGISINQSSGLLFVANGDKGIEVYDLNILLKTLL